MQNYKKLSDLLSSSECKAFVNKLITHEPAQIALQYRNKIPCDASVLALLIKLYQKAQQKLPLWVEHYCMLTTKSYEQASSQAVALYKSTFIQGNTLLVLGGGLGVDEWAFSKTFNTIVSIDNDADLNKCVAYNQKCLSINNVERITQTAEGFLKNNEEKFDFVYTDPDRREGEKRIKTLKNSLPNIPILLPEIFKHTNEIIIKASPLINIEVTIKELNSVEKVKVIAYKNEVKEVLFFLKKEYTGEVFFDAANFHNEDGWQEYGSKGKVLAKIEKQEEPLFFYEPNLAIIKAGLQQNYANEKGLFVVDKNTAYYTSKKKTTDFFGRVFKIETAIEFNKKAIKKYLNDEGITKANVSKRNFRLTVEELKKLFSIKDGGEHYLFFAQWHGKPYMFHCTKT